ncbi:MAG: transcriptional regulator [Chitinophagaceae bacterium]|nr:transcriptional regulator [Chitinophagaceae bacterium]
MTELKYPVVKNRAQYNAYCNALEELLGKPEQTNKEEEEIELLTTLIEVWDRQHSQTNQLDPIQLLRSFIREHKLKPFQIMKIMCINSRGHLYEILNYRKGLSKEVIRNLAAYFKVSQEAFNQRYSLKKSLSRVAAPHSVMVKATAKKKVNKRSTVTTRVKQNTGKGKTSKKGQPQPV